MPIRDRPSFAQQESIVALLAYSDEHGKLVANLADPALFEGDYRDIAIRCIDYWKQYQRPPKLHTADLFADILEDPENPRKADSFRRIFYAMAALAESSINAEYIINDLQGFTRHQSLKAAVLQAADLLQQPITPENTEAVEQALLDVAKARNLQFDRGMRLDDDLEPFIDYLQKHHAEFTTGIPALDKRGIVPARGEVMLFIAGKGKGKSWLATHIGKRALRAGKRVLHISTGDMSQMQVRGRYYQAIFSLPRHSVPNDIVKTTRLRYDLRGQVTGLLRDQKAPVEFDFDSPELRPELESHIEEYGSRIGNLIIQRFADGELSIGMLEAYLDSLEQIDGWVPDLLILDYPKCMKMRTDNPKDWRLNLRFNSIQLRKLAIQRNIALFAPDQLTRSGAKATKARSTDVGEDWSATHTADIVITHSATEAETELGLCRLFVDHARDAQDKFTVLLSQSFAIGQFVLDSAMMPTIYYDEIMPRDHGEQAQRQDADSQETEGYDEEDDDRGLIGDAE